MYFAASRISTSVHCRPLPLLPLAMRSGFVAFRRFQERDVVAIEIGVVLRTHVAAASPGLVADGEVLDLPRLVTAVLAPHLRERRVRVRGHVFEPVRHLLRRAGAHVAVHIGVSADEFREVHELVRAKRVVFHDTAPVGVHFFAGRDSRGPTPSRQWYSSAKQPPGQRNTARRVP
jgi:hypothetical protein